MMQSASLLKALPMVRLRNRPATSTQRGLVLGPLLGAFLAVWKPLSRTAKFRVRNHLRVPLYSQNHIVLGVVITQQNLDIFQVLLEYDFHRPRGLSQVQSVLFAGSPLGWSLIVPSVHGVAQ